MSSKTAEKFNKQLVRQNRELKYVKLGLMKVSPLVQRELRPARVDYLVAVMDLDKIGTPEVSFRDGHYFIMDGQHRIEAIRKWLGDGWEEQHLQCWVACGLSEQDEAEIFLSLNDKLNVDTFQKFKVAIRAGRLAECEIDQIVRSEKLVISKQKTPGAVRAVGTLMKVFKRDGPDSLRRALSLARDAFGDPGLDAPVIDGFGLLCHRYNGRLNDRNAIESLAKTHGGVNGVLGMAESLRHKTGNNKSHCVAAATVAIINRDLVGKAKLPSWWKE